MLKEKEPTEVCSDNNVMRVGNIRIEYEADGLVEPVIEKQTGSSKITSDQALAAVKNLSEVKEYLKRVPNGKVEVDNESEGEYNVHVYEIKNGHTATFNWYNVDPKTGKAQAQFKQ